MEGQIETAWLLEKRDADGSNARWLAIADGNWWWTFDSTKALRFARKQDGDALCQIIDDADYVTEHQWG